MKFIKKMTLLKYIREKLKKGVGRKEWTICAFSFVILLIIGGGIFTYGKYISVHSKEGIAVASSTYLSSNCLRPVDINDENTYNNYYNTNTWEGVGEYRFPIEVRNYENRLLYNDENLTILYDMSFQLVEDASKKWKYMIYWGEANNNIIELKYTGTTENTQNVTTSQNPILEITPSTGGKGDIVTIKGISLSGGTAKTNKMELGIQPLQENSVVGQETIGVKVTLRATAPNYLNSYLGTVLKASTSNTKFSITDSFPMFQDLAEENYQSTVISQSGFTYNIKTSGGADVATHKIKIEWDDQLEIDYFDPYYQQALQNKQFGTVENKKWMIIEVEPYSNILMNYYRTAKFKMENIPTIAAFEGLVKATVYEGK